MRKYKVDTITSLSRGLEVLRVLHDMRAASLHDLHLATGLPKSSLIRILVTCHEQGFVWQRMADGAFVPSHSMLVHGQLDDTDWLVEVASPVLEALVQRTRWSSVLSVPRLDYMETLETNSRKAYFDDVRRNPVGFRVNMLRSASGRAYLAFCPEPERKTVIRRLRQRSMPGHELACDDAWLEKMVRDTRRRGYSIRDPDFGGDYVAGRGGYDDQRMSIALPIRSKERVIGCVNLTWRRRVLTVRQVVAEHLDDLRVAVQDIERRVDSHGRDHGPGTGTE